MHLAGERMGQMQARGGWCVGAKKSVRQRARTAARVPASATHRECRARRRGQVGACGLMQIEGLKKGER